MGLIVVKNQTSIPVRVTALERERHDGKVRIVFSASPIDVEPGWRLVVAATISCFLHDSVQVSRIVKDRANMDIDNRIEVKWQYLVDRHGDAILLIKGFTC
ncbi:hypothetical protein ACFL26_02380 [Patescibacteria group bacterium]